MNLERERRIYDIVIQAQQQHPSRLKNFLEQTCLEDRELHEEVNKRLEAIHVIKFNAETLLKWARTDQP